MTQEEELLCSKCAEPQLFRRKMRLLFALGQVASAHHLEGPTERVLAAFAEVAEAYGDFLDSRQTTTGDFCPLLSTENQITGSLTQARRFVEKA